ncbi:MAG: helix-hairpin-helix domain-containing protein [Actinomycetota bacterium]|nr:helix-hairpin-helix domain-containing protein [Actinomycetota bacterium]
MIKRTSSALCILALGLTMALSSSAMAVTDPNTGAPVDTGSGVDVAPVTMTPEQIEAMEAAADGQTEEKNTFEKASDFVTDNAPFFIIGIIVIAAVLAGIFILRGRPGSKGKVPAPPKAKKGAGGPAAPSASEIRRRKRAAIQRSREEERLRRKAGIAGRKAVNAPGAGAAYGAAAFDPVQAEKMGAQQDQARAAGAVARSGGAIAAPYSPTQNAPAPGVVVPGQFDYPTEVQAAPPAAAEPPLEFPPQPVEPRTEPVSPAAPAAPPAAPGGQLEPEPALEAPGLDATVGNAAAAFAAATAGGAIGARAAAARPEAGPGPEMPEPAIDHPAADEVTGAPAPVIDARLQAKLDELKTGTPGAAFSPAAAARQIAPPSDPEISAGSADETTSAERPAVPDEHELSPGLAADERRLSADSEERDRTLREAEDRLRRIEQRAEDAERRAAFAERLAHLKIEESERERRLQDVVTGIDRAEQRASEAEARAVAAEEAAAAALERPNTPPADVPAEITEAAEASAPRESVTAPQVSEDAEEPAVEPERQELFGGTSRGASPVIGSEPVSAKPGQGGGGIDLNSATFEELRGLDLSVTQATRVLAYRERFGGYRSVDDLGKVPGFPPELIENLRSRFTA